MDPSDIGAEVDIDDPDAIPFVRFDPLRGSIRLDVIEGPLDNPTQVWDYKFGGARLTPTRVNQIRTGAGLQPNAPVTEVKP
jgi:hypothetical protein